MNYTNISHLGTSAHEWLSNLEFYKNELSIFDQRLLEISNKNTSKEATASIEHFQNQFDIQRNNISDLEHRIRDISKMASADIQQHANHTGVDVVSLNAGVGSDMKGLEASMHSLRDEFNRFLSKWM